MSGSTPNMSPPKPGMADDPPATLVRCPACGDGVVASGNDAACLGCGAVYGCRGRIIDLRDPGRRPEDAWSEVASAIDPDDWSRTARNLLARGGSAPVSSGALRVSRHAWTALLDYRPGGSVLVLGGGPGALATMMSRHAACITVADVCDSRLALVDHRLATNVRNVRAALVAIDDFTTLPFANASFDIVVAADVFESLRSDARGARSRAMTVIREMRRVTKPSGQIALDVPNRIDVTRLSQRPIDVARQILGQSDVRGFESTPAGYRRVLAAGGFPDVELHGLVLHNGYLDAIVPDPRSAPDSQHPPGGSPMERIRRTRYVQPHLALVSAPHERGGSLIDVVLAELARQLDTPPDTVRVKRLIVSRKDKLMLVTAVAADDAFVRVPLTDASLEFERVSHDVLRAIRDTRPGFGRSPRPLAASTETPLPFYAESLLPGVPVVDVRDRIDARAHLAEIGDLFSTLNPPDGGVERCSLDGDVYRRTIGDRLKGVVRLLADPDAERRLVNVFDRRVYGADTVVGLYHGDDVAVRQTEDRQFERHDVDGVVRIEQQRQGQRTAARGEPFELGHDRRVLEEHGGGQHGRRTRRDRARQPFRERGHIGRRHAYDLDAFLFQSIELASQRVKLPGRRDEARLLGERQRGQEAHEQIVCAGGQHNVAGLRLSDQPRIAGLHACRLRERVLPLVIDIARRIAPGRRVRGFADVRPGLMRMPGQQRAARHVESGVVLRQGFGPMFRPRHGHAARAARARPRAGGRACATACSTDR